MTRVGVSVILMGVAYLCWLAIRLLQVGVI